MVGSRTVLCAVVLCVALLVVAAASASDYYKILGIKKTASEAVRR
jgi:hypothetical protein